MTELHIGDVNIVKKRRVFTFGSNRQGRHGAGAALEAVTKWGAIYGQAYGLQGDSYAIVTKELRNTRPPVKLPEIAVQVRKFLLFAKNRPSLEFVVTPIGCGLAGFVAAEIAPMFKGATDNVKLPQEFLDVLQLEQLK